MSAERIEHPFANGTEGRAWMAEWCNRCLHDHGMHDDSGNGCPIFVHSIVGDDLGGYTPMIWQPYEHDWWHYLPAGIRCAAFEPCEPCGESVHLRPPVYGAPRPVPEKTEPE